MVYIHTVEYYSAIKAQSADIYYKVVNPQNFMVSEKTQTYIIIWFHVYEKSSKGNTIEIERRLVVSGVGGENGEWLQNGHGGSLWGDRSVPKLDSGDGCTIL